MTTTMLYFLSISLFLFTSIPAPVSAARQVTNTTKAGLAWAGGRWDDIEQFEDTAKVSWYYSWAPTSSAPTDQLEFVPMLWGHRQIEEFTATINESIANGATTVLGFNEPQEEGQSNMSPEEGAQLWKTYLEPLKAQGIRLGSPAPSGAPSGTKWLQDFLTACNGGCTVDFIATHWYDIGIEDFIEYVEGFHNTFQRPIWITEWACQNFNDVKAQCSSDDVVELLNKTQTFLDETDYVERYAWFGAMRDLSGVNEDNALLDKSGELTDLGLQYMGSEGHTDGGDGAGSLAVPMFGALTALIFIFVLL